MIERDGYVLVTCYREVPEGARWTTAPPNPGEPPGLGESVHPQGRPVPVGDCDSFLYGMCFWVPRESCGAE